MVGLSSNFERASTKDTKSKSLYKSLNMSIRTPFTNVGKVDSRYGGQNKMLRCWYDSKQFKGVNHQGFALNRLNQSNDIYSQFSGK